jgi:uncharacterized protein YndB with AHSA1/START domain
MELRFQVHAKIKKPVEEVFDAVYNPKKLSGYFTTAGASGPLETGATVKWEFADFPGAFPVHVKETIRNQKIVLEWEGSEGSNTRVEMTFEPLDKESTLVKISESGWKQENQKSLDASYGNCEGWTQMLACLKVYVEHGINLREFYY